MNIFRKWQFNEKAFRTYTKNKRIRRLFKTFYNGAFRLAIQSKTPIKPILFLDTHKRLHFNSIFSLNPGICRGVYLPEISVDGYTSKEVILLKEKVYLAMENGLKQFACKD